MYARLDKSKGRDRARTLEVEGNAVVLAAAEREVQVLDALRRGALEEVVDDTLHGREQTLSV